jgi:hypothetical protein
MRWSDIEMFRAISDLFRFVFRAGGPKLTVGSGTNRAVPVPFKFTLQAVSSRSSSSNSSSIGGRGEGTHLGMPGDWSSKGKVNEEIWVRDHEQATREDEERLYKLELGKIETELEDLLIDEYMTAEAKGKIIAWKMKLVDCLSPFNSNKAPSKRNPNEAVLDAQTIQSDTLSDLDNLLHLEGLDLSDKAKRSLIDWKLGGQ